MTDFVDAASGGLAAWLGTYLLHSTLLLAGAWVACRYLRAAAMRERVWRAALLAGVLTASVQLAIATGPGLDLGLSPRPAPAGTGADGRVLAFPGDLRAPRRDAGGLRPERAADRGADRRALLGRPAWSTAAVGAWLLVAAFLVSRLARDRRGLRRLLTDRRPLRGGEVVELLRELRATTGFGRPVTLSASARLASPAALSGGEICVPERALSELDRSELAALLAHELAHLARRDPERLALLALFERLFFVQPLNRLATRRLADEAELRCDAWSARATGGGLALARCLSRVASWVEGGPAALPATAMVRRASTLVERVRLALEPPAEPSRARLAAGSVVLALGVGAVACAGPGVRAPGREPVEEVFEELEEPEEVLEEEPEEEVIEEPREPGRIAVTELGPGSSGPADLELAIDALGGVRLEGGEVAGRGPESRLDALKRALRPRAEAMPADASGPGRGLPSGTVRIVADPEVDFGAVLEVLQACGAVMLWNLELEIEGHGLYAVPLPRDVGVRAGPVRRAVAEVKLEQGGRETIVLDRADLGLFEARPEEDPPRPRTTERVASLEDLGGALAGIPAEVDTAVVLEVKAGVPAGEVARVLRLVAALEVDGFAFVGRMSR